MAAVIRGLAEAAALAGCARFDLDEPIELVPERSWTDDEVATLEAAATCWNLEFGTRFAVTAEPSVRQVVDVQYNDFACAGGAGGVYTPGPAGEIDICPPEYWEYEEGYTAYPFPLFTVLVHELGHAAGIRVEGEGDYSIMGQAFQTGAIGWPVFSAEDHQLLAEAAPDFTITPACDQLIFAYDPTLRLACRCR